MERDSSIDKELTFKTPDIEEISRPKRPPPMQAKEPTTYYDDQDKSRSLGYETYTLGWTRLLRCTVESQCLEITGRE